jgi:hypothetical protein
VGQLFVIYANGIEAYELVHWPVATIIMALLARVESMAKEFRQNSSPLYQSLETFVCGMQSCVVKVFAQLILYEEYFRKQSTVLTVYVITYLEGINIMSGNVPALDLLVILIPAN